MNLSVVIPLWNEEKNIPFLIKEIISFSFESLGIDEVILVNNGSSDRTGDLIQKASNEHALFKTVQLVSNVNYGGGILAGIKYAKNNYIAIIPGDLQVRIIDLVKVWQYFADQAQNCGDRLLLVKGFRNVRKDPWHTRMVSFVYTKLTCLILGVSVKDVNGLPKIFSKILISHLPSEKMFTFVLDAQILLFTSLLGWPIFEVEVSFEARREGISSWSGKRFKTYIDSLKKLLLLRRQKSMFIAKSVNKSKG